MGFNSLSEFAARLDISPNEVKYIEGFEDLKCLASFFQHVYSSVSQNRLTSFSLLEMQEVFLVLKIKDSKESAMQAEPKLPPNRMRCSPESPPTSSTLQQKGCAAEKKSIDVPRGFDLETGVVPTILDPHPSSHEFQLSAVIIL